MTTISKGITLALATAFFSGINNFVTKIAVTALNDPLLFTTLKNALVGVVLVCAIVLLKRYGELKKLNRLQIVQLFFIAAIGGCVPFILYFTGLAMIPALNAAFIHKTLFLWVALLALPTLKERLGFTQIAALALLFIGNLTLGLPKLNFNTGEILVLLATMLWALENIIAKKVLTNLSSITVAGVRMAGGSLLLFLILTLKGGNEALLRLNAAQWGWTLLTALLLFGYVTTWYSALKKIPATAATALLVPATIITNILTGIFITHTMTKPQIYNGILIIFGLSLLIMGLRKVTTSFGSRNSSPTLSYLKRGNRCSSS
ncbi:MAG: DMT family transporter [Patescibacteria group bacterium]